MFVLAGAAALAPAARGQMIDRTQAPNLLDEGIAKSLEEQIGPGRGNWNTPGSSSVSDQPRSSLFEPVADESGFPGVKRPLRQPFLVRNIFTDFKRHDLGPAFHERNWDGTTQKEFLTRPLWGVGSKIAFGHDGRSVNLYEVILRHGGAAQRERDAFATLTDTEQQEIIEFLRTLVLFPPEDTASNLDPGDRSHEKFPQMGHGSIRLTNLFNDPSDRE
jgi:hypothetical protein